MLAWLRRRRQANRLAQADAEALIRDHGGASLICGRKSTRRVLWGWSVSPNRARRFAQDRQHAFGVDDIVERHDRIAANRARVLSPLRRGLTSVSNQQKPRRLGGGKDVSNDHQSHHPAIAGAIGGNAAGAISKDVSFGTGGNTIAGALGGIAAGRC